MTRKLLVAALAAATCSFLVACGGDKGAATDTSTPAATSTAAPGATAAAPGEPAATKPAPTDFDQLAKRIVANAAVKEGDIVLVTGQSHDGELLEDLAVAVRSVGAFPIVDYDTDRLSKRMFFDVPEKWDTQTNAAGLKFAEMVDVVISLGNGTSENLFEGADPKRMAARGKAGEPVGAAFLKNKVRTYDIGNNLYPTPWRAQRFGMSEDDLTKMFWNGVNIDYAELQKRGDVVKSALAGGSEVKITHPNGTDLTVNIKGRPVIVSDGIVSEDDLKAGGVAAAAYVPAGEVYTTPVAGTANGKLVNTKAWYRGKEINNLTMTFKDGKMDGITGEGPGFADLKAEYDAVDDARKNEFSFVDFGINPNIQLPATSAVGNWVPAGTVTVGTGSNTWAGGNNAVPYGQTVSLPGATVTLDGKAIVENGALKL